MNDLHLSGDGRQPVQNHLEELSSKVTSVVILTVILTGIWSVSIDEILRYVLRGLDPCNNSCVNIFSPDEWAGTRWLSAGLLGLLTAFPFAMVQAYTFAKPGLLPSERRGLVAWMFMIWVLSFGSIIVTVTQLLPWLYSHGHSFNTDTGLVGRYDAAEMLRIAISIAWAMILILSAMSVVAVAGVSKLMWKGNSNWWRLRIHGMMLMLLWLVIPTNLPGLLFTLTITASGLVELIGWKSFRAPIPTGYGMKEILDYEGRKNRILYVDCSCCGTSPSIQPLHGMGLVKYDSVCRNSSEQDELLDAVKRFNATKIVFSGCTSDSFPADFIDSLRFLGCQYDTLNLSYLINVRTDGNLVDCNLAMAWLRSPWSELSAITRCLDILSSCEVKTLNVGEEIPFGINLLPGEALLTMPTESLLREIENIGIKVKYL